MKHEHPIQKYTAPEGAWRVGLITFILAILAVLMAFYAPRAQSANTPVLDEYVASSGIPSELPLHETWINKVVDKTKETKTFEAVQTKYSRADSCHYPKKVGGKVICLTAIGRDTNEGTTVACPRNLKLGTRIFIEGLGERVCEDRYNENLDGKRGLPTIDVFAEAPNLHALPGRKVVKVTILK